MPSLLKSLAHAATGIVVAVREQRNLKIHLLALAGVIVAGFALGLARLEWALVVLASCMVIALEVVNSAIETLIDHLHPQEARRIGLAKDMAAAAVLIAALGAMVVGVIILAPRLRTLVG